MSDEGWVTDKDVLYTLVMLDGIQPGDEVKIVGDPKENHDAVRQWDNAVLRVEAKQRCILLSAPNGPNLIEQKGYGWIDKDIQARIIIGWRRPCAKKT
jgi:hypothetical protein